MMVIFEELEKSLHYTFQDQMFLKEALYHSSLVQPKTEGESLGDWHARGWGRVFDRLEFLGDRVLNLLVADKLYHHFPEESEGDMAKRFTALVCFEACAEVANEIELSRFLKVASGTTFNDLRILCDALEAVIGAMYLDGGLEPCRGFVDCYWEGRITNLSHPPENAKSLLQERVQAEGKPLPVYEVLKKTGSEHSPHYVVSVLIEGYLPITGEGRSKKTAEKDAACNFLKQHSKAFQKNKK